MKIRRQFTPPETPSAGTASNEAQGVHATRRAAARRELNLRVILKPNGDVAGEAEATDGQGASAALEGWALNVSRGGVRLILEPRVQLGAEFEVTFSDGVGPTDAAGVPVVATPCPGRVVWVQEEPDGVVVGIAFRAADTPSI